VLLIVFGVGCFMVSLCLGFVVTFSVVCLFGWLFWLLLFLDAFLFGLNVAV